MPTDADARYWLYFAPPQSSRVISAADVLAGNVAQLNELSNHLVLVGFYAEGLQDVISTPLGDRRAGVEAHAELIENIFDRQMLARPHWAGKAEAFMFLFWSSLAIWLVPLGRPLRSIALFSGAIVLLLGAGFALFRAQGMLFDVATPALGILVTFGSMLALTLAESDRRRRLLAGALAVQREQQARFEGELAAAQRIQMGLLPQPKVALAGDTRADIAAFIEPARSIGGDLYDFFKLDVDHLFIAIGDVSGKGVPASLFMALAKSLTKSSALRDDTDLALKISRAQTEITRDNPEFMFITLVALVLNLRTGHLRYVNAGHETPLIVNADGARLLEEGGGPPLCVMDDFVFTSAETHLARNDLLVLVTDGVTEALDPKDNLYGRERLNRTLRAHVTADATAVIAALRADVLTFADGTELPDDLAVVAVRYLG